MGKVIGGILLLIGTSIGSGMLALPIATAAGGFFHSSALLFVAWMVTTLAAFYILEVNLWLPEGSNMVTMARKTLGRWGELATWISYCLLLYSLLCAYAAGGSDLLNMLFHLAHINTHSWFDTVVFMVVLGAVVFFGIRVVDLTNRGLMSVKLTAFLLVVLLILPHFKVHDLVGGNYRLLGSAVLVVVTSFGYATIVPVLRRYFKSDVNKLRLVIGLGSFGSLLIYVLWDFTVQGNIAAAGPHGLIAISESGRSASELTRVLSSQVHSQWVFTLTHIFTSVCMTTSFLGVALCLVDFLSDGFNLNRVGFDRWRGMVMTLLPPMVVVIFDPDLFIVGLRCAGIFCVVLLMLIPCFMVWSGRYVKNMATGYQVIGGRVFITVEVLIALTLVIYGGMHF
jgi:tyrosine-specific transport protein